MQKIIEYAFYAIATLIPITFTTINNELFEFPKFLILLFTTGSIAIAWIIDLISAPKPTATQPQHQTKTSKAINIAMVLFLISQTTSTILSIHPYTSFWGYYTRFHQGLLTTICYTILFFAYQKYMHKQSTHKFITISIYTAFIVSIYAILERLGIDKKLWVQDVVNRPFSTLGQPNWLATYLIPNIYFLIHRINANNTDQLENNKKQKKHQTNNNPTILNHIILLTLVSGLILTKSRSVYLAMAITLPTYFTLTMINSKSKIRTLKLAIVTATYFITAIALFGTPWTRPIYKYIHKTNTQSSPIKNAQNGTAMARGGTESGEIRKIVWKGAWQLFKQHPIIGTGVETFAYTYYWTRPIEHNFVSEWDFLYNKAHNEFLNILANSGIIGLITYIMPFIILVLTHQTASLSITLKTSIIAIMISNFFGFSVIPVATASYAILAMYITDIKTKTITRTETRKNKKTPTTFTDPTNTQLISLFISMTVLAYYILNNLFTPDLYYTKAKKLTYQNKQLEAIPYFEKAISKRPNLALYHSTFSEALAKITVALSNSQYKDKAKILEQLTIQHINKTKQLNKWHLNFYKSRAKAYISLAEINKQYYELAAREVEEARQLAPTDPKLAYNLGLIYSRMNKNSKAIDQMKDAIKLKNDYPDPYYALILLYQEQNQTDKLIPLLQQAKQHLSPIPNNIKRYIEKTTDSTRPTN